MAQGGMETDHQSDFHLLINGELQQGSTRLNVINPAEGQVFATCPAAGPKDLDAAVDSARRAATEWRTTSFEQRAEYIRKLADVLRENQTWLADLLTRWSKMSNAKLSCTIDH